MDLERRRSLIRLNSLVTPNQSESSIETLGADAPPQEEDMNIISQICSKKDISDSQMCTILDKIVENHRI